MKYYQKINTATESPLVTMGCPTFTRKTNPSDTPIHRPTPFTTPNGIQIQSAVLPQYTPSEEIDRQTDTWDWRQVAVFEPASY